MVSTSFIVAALSTLPMSFAYYYPPANGTTTLMPQPTATGAAKTTHTVAVGQNGLTFTPDTINAKVGEDVVFQFFPKNHSVVQSDFASPCVAKEGGIFSGFTFNTTEGTADTTFTVTVSDEKPVWLYCSQNQPKPHCAAGMVAVINPPAQGPNTLAAYKEAAAKTNTSTSPAGGVSGGKVSTPGTPSSPNSPSGTSTGNPAESTGSASSLQVSGALGVVAVFAGLFL
ncbi:Cupredoxin [Lentithecium fluviatile CBS 122367]|uniref:Cupredoxin n=1 Tax=Lentithecium fluviatile CBS 122367 TaxID=1168545 RepID=A0A6G1JCN6_9PLEO|nr:Cupredoxin [Lentithecium fluviatile CBS 122367]